MRQSHIYLAIKECKEEYGAPVELSCDLLGVSRAAYYRWLSGKKCRRELENEKIAEIVEQIHTENPDKGRRIKDDLTHDHKLNVNEKRVLRICRSLDIKSTIRYKNNGCTRQAANPQHIAKNWLNRQFHSDRPNEKWLTDVTEFKYYIGPEVHKIYLSAILDLYDRRIVAYIIRDRNDNPLVFDTLDAAIATNPDAHPLFHSDRGFQYTNRTFYAKLQAAKMKQSMSRVAKCIDNGPMEGFWGILKRERYYGRRFTSREELVQMIENYITYYNNSRVQRSLGVLTPMEKHNSYLLAA